MRRTITWSRNKGYEVSSKGDARFSALNARMPDGRTIEEWYQCDIKGYDRGGTNWRLGKGQPPVFPYPDNHLWELYLALWRIWGINNGHMLEELAELAQAEGDMLSDRFATTKINQAHALSNILNDWIV